jgi:hypothetical protein
MQAAKSKLGISPQEGVGEVVARRTGAPAGLAPLTARCRPHPWWPSSGFLCLTLDATPPYLLTGEATEAVQQQAADTAAAAKDTAASTVDSAQQAATGTAQRAKQAAADTAEGTKQAAAPYVEGAKELAGDAAATAQTGAEVRSPRFLCSAGRPRNENDSQPWIRCLGSLLHHPCLQTGAELGQATAGGLAETASISKGAKQSPSTALLKCCSCCRALVEAALPYKCACMPTACSGPGRQAGHRWGHHVRARLCSKRR